VLALAHACTPLAVAWVASAHRAVTGAPTDLLRSACATNFAWSAVRNERACRRRIRRSLSAIARVLAEESVRYAAVSLERARETFHSDEVPPAYAVFGDRIYFTPAFAEFGPLCRTAMIVHEAVHVFDARSGEPEIHVSEWDARFASRTPEQQLHNPSAYASFTAQIHERRLDWPVEARYGAGNRTI
jgi:hypothetical protein